MIYLNNSNFFLHESYLEIVCIGKKYESKFTHLIIDVTEKNPEPICTSTTSPVSLPYSPYGDAVEGKNITDIKE